MMMVDGKTVAAAFALVSKCGDEVENLSELLAQQMSDAIKGDPKLPFIVAGEFNWQYQNDSSDWLVTDIAGSLPLKSKGKGNKRIAAYLGFQISMTGDGIGIPSNAEPLLHVFLWDCAVDFDQVWIGFPWDESEFKVVDDRLMLWSEQGTAAWGQGEWQYSLRLIDLNTPEEVYDHCVAPALALLRGMAPREALPDDLPALFRYPEKSLLLGE
ncbi:MAG: hypothetical protein KJZ96_16605 [Rhodocyclaceae bacterium]|nr:hypothetical protein [Rhodocyclaceae bacterium]